MPFTLSLSTYVVVSTIIATLISGGINTGISYALYFNKEAETALWTFPSTVAGDVVLTCVIGSIITWILSGQLSLMDLSDRGPLRITGLPWQASWHHNSAWWSWLASRSYRSILGATTEKDTTCHPLRNFVYCAATGAVVGVLLVVPTLGVVFVVAGYLTVEHNAVPDENGVIWTMSTLLVYKGLLGALMGVMLQPLIVLLVATKPMNSAVDQEEGDDDHDEETGSDKPTETTTTEVTGQL